MTNRMTLKPMKGQQDLKANVYLANAKGLYERTARRNYRMVLLPGSVIPDDHDPHTWPDDDLKELCRLGFVKKVTEGYEIIRPVVASVSAAAAAVLGKNGPSKPNGYVLWTFENKVSIVDAGERPE